MIAKTALAAQLLGTVKILAHNRDNTFSNDKHHQLLAYLAYAGDWVSREKLADLFYTDTMTLHLGGSSATDTAKVQSDWNKRGERGNRSQYLIKFAQDRNEDGNVDQVRFNARAPFERF